MENSKLVGLISTFSKREQQAFRDFVRSPFFNKNKQVEKLMEFVLKQAPDFRSPQFNTKKASNYIGIGNNHSKLSQIQTKLFKLAEEFIAQSAFQNDQLQAGYYLLDFYVDHQLEPLYQGQLKKVKKNIQNEKRRDKRSYWIYRTEDLHSEFLVSRKDDGTGDLNRLESARALDLYYALSKLKQSCIILNRRRIAAFDLKEFDFSEPDQILKDRFLADNPFVKTWYSALRLLRDGGVENYKALKDQLKGRTAEFHEEEIRNLYTFLENSTTSVFPRTELYAEVFALYDQQIANDVLLNNEYILPATFRNIVTVGLVLKKPDWVREFISNYRSTLPEDHPDSRDTLSYSMAQLHFMKGDFEKTIDFLNEIHGKNMYMKLNERRMRMKVYYELRYSQAFEDLVNSFRKFLSGKKTIIPEKHIQGHRDFVNCCMSLFKIIKKDHDKIEKLSDQIKAITFLPEKNWLLDKLEGLR